MPPGSTQPPDDGPSADSSNRALVGLVIALVLVAIGWFVVDRLSSANDLSDCINSGRRNCVPLDTTTPSR